MYFSGLGRRRHAGNGHARVAAGLDHIIVHSIDEGFMAAQKAQGEFARFRACDGDLDVLLADGVFIHARAVQLAQLTIDENFAIEQAGFHQKSGGIAVAAGGEEGFHARCAQTLQRFNGAGRHGVGLKAHQRAVDIKKSCFDLHKNTPVVFARRSILAYLMGLCNQRFVFVLLVRPTR